MKIFYIVLFLLVFLLVIVILTSFLIKSLLFIAPIMFFAIYLNNKILKKKKPL